MSCCGKLLFGRVARDLLWGEWLCSLWLPLLAFDVSESSWREREREKEKRKLCLLCKQLIMLLISTSLPYNGDRNLIIQRHSNVTILVVTYSLLITMPLTLCNLLCELGHIKNITLVTASQGTTEDRTRIIGIERGHAENCTAARQKQVAKHNGSDWLCRATGWKLTQLSPKWWQSLMVALQDLYWNWISRIGNEVSLWSWRMLSDLAFNYITHFHCARNRDF